MAVLGFTSAVVVSLGVCGIAYLVGPRLGVLDAPDAELKTHERPVVPLGGAGLIVGLHVGLLVVDLFDPALLWATLIVWLLGFVDDAWGLSPVLRIIGATGAGVVLAALSDFSGGALVFVFWVIATVVVVNAINLLDGMDGLVGTVSIVALAGLWWFAVLQETFGPLIYVVAIGGILGFLFWNLPPARVFLGDNGAYVVGVTLIWAALRASPDGTASLVGVAIIGVPLLDLAITVGRRLSAGSPLFDGDRDHTYDRMHAAGRGVGVVLVVFAIAEVLWVVWVVWIAAVFGDGAGVLAAVIGAVVAASLIFSLRFRRAA